MTNHIPSIPCIPPRVSAASAFAVSPRTAMFGPVPARLIELPVLGSNGFFEHKPSTLIKRDVGKQVTPWRS